MLPDSGIVVALEEDCFDSSKVFCSCKTFVKDASQRIHDFWRSWHRSASRQQYQLPHFIRVIGSHHSGHAVAECMTDDRRRFTAGGVDHGRYVGRPIVQR
jgi:hypothetical protein